MKTAIKLTASEMQNYLARLYDAIAEKVGTKSIDGGRILKYNKDTGVFRLELNPDYEPDKKVANEQIIYCSPMFREASRLLLPNQIITALRDALGIGDEEEKKVIEKELSKIGESGMGYILVQWASEHEPVDIPYQLTFDIPTDVKTYLDIVRRIKRVEVERMVKVHVEMFESEEATTNLEAA